MGLGSYSWCNKSFLPSPVLNHSADKTEATERCSTETSKVHSIPFHLTRPPTAHCTIGSDSFFKLAYLQDGWTTQNLPCKKAFFPNALLPVFFKQFLNDKLCPYWNAAYNVSKTKKKCLIVSSLMILLINIDSCDILFLVRQKLYTILFGFILSQIFWYSAITIQLPNYEHLNSSCFYYSNKNLAIFYSFFCSSSGWEMRRFFIEIKLLKQSIFSFFSSPTFWIIESTTTFRDFVAKLILFFASWN